MSKDVTEKEAALISAAIAAYLAKPEGSRVASTSQQGELKLLISRVAKLEERIDKLDRTLKDIIELLKSKRVQEVK